MRIAYVLTEFPALTEHFVVTECQALADRGVEIIPFSHRRPNPPPKTALHRAWAARTRYPSILDPRALLRAPPALLRVALSRLRAAPAALRPGLATAVSLAWCANLAQQATALGCTHIHAHFARGAATLAAVSAAFADLPFSVTAHAFGVYKSRPHRLRARLAPAAFVRATSRHLAARLPVPAHVIPTPVDLTALPYRAPAPLPKGPLRLLAIARAHPKKGLDQLQSLDLGRPTTLRVFGPNTPGGPLDHDQVIAEMRAAHLFVLPSRVTADGDRDGLPVVLLEAFALGLPAVSTTVAGIPELFCGPLGAHLAPPDQPAALRDAALRALRDPQRTAHTQRQVVEAHFGPAVLDRLIRLWA